MDGRGQNKACTTGRKTGAQPRWVGDLWVSNHLLLSQLTTAVVRGGSHSQPSVFRGGEAKNRHRAELLEESNLHAVKGNHCCHSEGLSEAHVCN